MAETERYRLEQLWINTAYKMASFYLKQKNLEMTEAWHVKIGDLRPEEVDARFYLMKLYADMGYRLLVNRKPSIYPAKWRASGIRNRDECPYQMLL